ncbi:hypothetical protein MPR_1359 [Myroides profundi]|nr:hypothetical protein MPR_1359 [Myroides profundi]
MIVYFILANPKIDVKSIGPFLGLKSRILNQRIRGLVRDKILIKEKTYYNLTKLAIDVYIDKKEERVYEGSYDFYVDGVGLRPLSEDFYNYSYIEEESFIDTEKEAFNKRRQKKYQPDVVSNVPDLKIVKDNILQISKDNRKDFKIPQGLKDLIGIEPKRMALELLVSVVRCCKTNTITKEFINGHAFYNKQELDCDYYEFLKKGLESFNSQVILNKIEKLSFKINNNNNGSSKKIDEQTQFYLGTNWFEVDRASVDKNICYNFSDYDLLGYLNSRYSSYKLNHKLTSEDLENTPDKISIKVNKELLLNSGNPKNLLDSLVRGRDYEINTTRLENNYFLIMYYFKPEGCFVEKLLEFYKEFTAMKLLNEDLLDEDYLKLKQNYGSSCRVYLNIMGAQEVLEKRAIREFMINLECYE